MTALQVDKRGQQELGDTIIIVRDDPQMLLFKDLPQKQVSHYERISSERALDAKVLVASCEKIVQLASNFASQGAANIANIARGLGRIAVMFGNGDTFHGATELNKLIRESSSINQNTDRNEKVFPHGLRATSVSVKEVITSLVKALNFLHESKGAQLAHCAASLEPEIIKLT